MHTVTSGGWRDLFRLDKWELRRVLKADRETTERKQQNRTPDKWQMVVVAVDHFYIALFSALEQTHCARM